MSLNQIYDNPADQSVKSWQNYRFNNLNIKGAFNIDTTGAQVGDILSLNASLQPVWVPFFESLAQDLQYVQGTFTNLNVLLTKTELTIASIINGGAAFSLTSNRITCNANNTAVVVFLKMSTVPITIGMPVFWIERIRSGTETYFTRMSPYRTPQDASVAPVVSCACMAPMVLQAGDQVVVYGQMTSSSNSAVGIQPSECVISILKI